MRYLTAIPVFNEAGKIPAVLAEVRRVSPHVLCVNDGSTDGSADVLASIPGVAVVTHPKNRGYGAALITAFAYALEHGYDGLVTTDCDGQHEPARIPALVAALEGGADIASGTRYLRDFRQDTAAPGDRRSINGVITAELNERFGLSLTDAFCGFKAYTRGALSVLRVTEEKWGMPLQVWVQAARMGLRIEEVTVPRIYLDANRSFGADFDDAERRLAYYRGVIDAADAPFAARTESAVEACS